MTADGRMLFAGAGLGGDVFMTFWSTNDGMSRRRFKSKLLPERKTLEAAQHDLESYAQINRLEEVKDGEL